MAPTEQRPVQHGYHQDLIAGEQDDRSLTQTLFAPVWAPLGRGWWMLFLPALLGSGIFFLCIWITVTRGIGVWGNNIPVAWAFGIVNFVWWIGIGHAGTLISAILLLFLQKWRTSVNRFAEAMTLFAVMCAGLYPLLHLGRPWFAYWLIPYPATMSVWPQFRSPLTWDVFAVSTYFTVSLIFWYLGLVPDLAALRDASPRRIQRIVYGIFSLGWRGSATQWRHYQIAYLLLAGLATPLVLSVHTIVSFDFAVSLIPGWHETIFPPYFVAGAVFSGLALVMTLIVPARRFLGLKHVITLRHLEAINKLTLATSIMVAYGYAMENFINRYNADQFDIHAYANRQTGRYAWMFWIAMIGCNVLLPQCYWSKKLRTNVYFMWFASILINFGMWSERFIIIVSSLTQDFIPTSWRLYAPSIIDLGLYLGSLCFFSTLFLLFLRFVPPVSASEVKELNAELHHQAAA